MGAGGKICTYYSSHRLRAATYMAPSDNGGRAWSELNRLCLSGELLADDRITLGGAEAQSGIFCAFRVELLWPMQDSNLRTATRCTKSAVSVPERLIGSGARFTNWRLRDSPRFRHMLGGRRIKDGVLIS